MKYNDYPYLGVLVNAPVMPASSYDFEINNFESSPSIRIWHEGKIDIIKEPIVSVRLYWGLDVGLGLTYVVAVPGGTEERNVIAPLGFPFGFMLDCQNWSPQSFTLFENAVLDFFQSNIAISLSWFYIISYYNAEYQNVVSVSRTLPKGKYNPCYFFYEELNYLNFNYNGSDKDEYPFGSFLFGYISDSSVQQVGVLWKEESSTGPCTGYLIPETSMCIIALTYNKYSEGGELKSFTLEVLEDLFHDPCSHAEVPAPPDPRPTALCVTGKLDSCGKFYFEIETENSNRLEISCNGEVIEEIEL